MRASAVATSVGDMAGRKRALSAPSAAAAEPTVTLSGGAPCPPGQIQLWRSETLCDVHVQAAGGAPFAAHRLVLAAGSSTLRALLTSEMRDKATPALPDVPADAFMHVLGFLYEGSCEPERRLLPELLRAANYLGVEPLKLATVTALQSLIGPENALDAWSLGEQQAAPELATAAKETALARFEELGDSLAAAPLDKVQVLLADERLTAVNEEAVFTAVQRVVDARQPSPDEATVLGLMRHVRFACMRREFLDGTVRQWPRLQNYAGSQLLLDALAVFLGARPAARLGIGPRSLWVLGGNDDEDNSLDSTEVFDFRNSAWAAGPPLCTAHQDGAAAVVGDKLYLLGGQEEDDLFLSTVEAFDSRTGAWSLVAPMLTGRCWLAAASVGGRLYAIGGHTTESVASGTVEAFDPQTGTWMAVAPMPTPRREMGAAVVGGKIYVVGGYSNELARLATVEVYDPATDSWATAAPLPTARDCLGVAALGGKIFAVGGTERLTGEALATVEVYDPQTTTWATAAPMSTPRQYLGLAEVCGKLYAVGGDQGDGPPTAERYDPTLDRWMAIAPPSNLRDGFAVAAM